MVDSDTFGAAFLAKVANQVKESFLSPLGILRGTYSTVPDLPTLRRFVNDLNQAFAPLVSLEAELFYSRYFHFVQMKSPDGQTVYDQRPVELKITLAPFRSWMDEIGRVARTTVESIGGWSKQTHEQDTSYFDFLARKQERSGARLQVVSEMLLIVLSVVVSAFFLTANDPFNLIKKNVELQGQLTERAAELRAASQQLGAVARENQRLKTELEQTRQGGRLAPGSR